MLNANEMACICTNLKCITAFLIDPKNMFFHSYFELYSSLCFAFLPYIQEEIPQRHFNEINGIKLRNHYLCGEVQVLWKQYYFAVHGFSFISVYTNTFCLEMFRSYFRWILLLIVVANIQSYI